MSKLIDDRLADLKFERDSEQILRTAKKEISSFKANCARRGIPGGGVVIHGIMEIACKAINELYLLRLNIDIEQLLKAKDSIGEEDKDWLLSHLIPLVDKYFNELGVKNAGRCMNLNDPKNASIKENIFHRKDKLLEGIKREIEIRSRETLNNQDTKKLKPKRDIITRNPDKFKLVFRGFLKGIPWVGPAIDALFFGES